jgi:erythrin-vacuolar iron transport family protein
VSTATARAQGQRDERSFPLHRAQPAMTGLTDGSLSTLAPIFAVAFARARPGHGRPAPGLP